MMFNIEDLSIINDLKVKGYRITPVRRAILEVFFSNKKPLSVLEITNNLHKKDLSANKTTIYREIEFLLAENLILQIEFGDRKKRYELIKNGEHHHHVICLTCGKVEDIELKADLLDDEKRIETETGFKVSQHAIELFGKCADCQK